MRTILQFFLLFMAISSSSQAKISTFYTLGNEGKLIANEPDFDRDVQGITHAIDAFGLADLAINIIVRPEGDNASFDSGYNIEIPRSMRFTNDWGTEPVYKTTVDALAVYAHEYGHAVFDTGIAKAIPAYGEIQSLRRRMSSLTLAALDEKKTAEEIKSIAAELKTSEDAFKADRTKIKLYILTLYYHELFADTIAVYAMDNKSAIYEALFNPNIPIWRKDQLEFVRARDFASSHPLDTWKDDSDHNLLAPLRSQIGSDECWPKNAADKIKKLKHLSSLLLTDMVTKYKTQTMPQIADNKTLIEKFKEICH